MIGPVMPKHQSRERRGEDADRARRDVHRAHTRAEAGAGARHHGVGVDIAHTTPDATIVVFEDIERENWAQGGVLASTRTLSDLPSSEGEEIDR